jgi:hypothetical protein
LAIQSLRQRVRAVSASRTIAPVSVTTAQVFPDAEKMASTRPVAVNAGRHVAPVAMSQMENAPSLRTSMSAASPTATTS